MSLLAVLVFVSLAISVHPAEQGCCPIPCAQQLKDSIARLQEVLKTVKEENCPSGGSEEGGEPSYPPGGDEDPAEIEEPPEEMEPEGTGIDCPGNTMKTMDICYECCAQECKRLNKCVGFVYSLFDRAEAHCILKKDSFCDKKVEQPLTSAYRKVITGGRAPGGTETFEEITQPPQYFYLYDSNVDCPGHDLLFRDMSFDLCAGLCYRNLDCAGFMYTLDPVDNRYCFLKTKGLCDNPVKRNNTVVYIQENATSINDIETIPEGYVRALNKTGIDCPGNTLETINNCFECCVRSCRMQEESCVGFVYSLNEAVADNCILKHTSICDAPVYLADTVAYRKLEGWEIQGRKNVTFEEEDNPFES